MYHGLSGTDTTPEQDRLRALHATAVALYAARQAGDTAEVARLLTVFQEQADAIRAQGDTDMTAIDRFILATGNYLSGVVDALPQALAALPKAAGESIGLALKPLVPVVVIGLGLLWLAGRTPGARRFL